MFSLVSAPLGVLRTSSRFVHTAASLMVPTVEQLQLLRKDKQEYQAQNSDTVMGLKLKDGIENFDLGTSRSSRLSCHRMTKASDYVWALKQNLLEQHEHQNTAFIDTGFSLLEKSIYSVNDVESSSLVSIDLNLSNNVLKEIGIAIYDASQNSNNALPNIINRHIIVEEYHGVLSTNKFHGESDIMPLKNALELIQSVLDFYFTPSEITNEKLPNSKLIGFHSSYLLKSFEKFDIKIPSTLETIDIYELYSIPFQYNEKLSQQAILKFPRFLQLDTILRRLNLPHSFLINCGNSSYYQLIALLSMTNPYHRIRFKLDNILGNFEYMESFLIDQLNEFLKQSEGRTQLNNKMTITGYDNWQKTTSLSFPDHQSALSRAFKDQ